MFQNWMMRGWECLSTTAGKHFCFLENKLLSSRQTMSGQQRLFKSRGDEFKYSKATKHRTDYEPCDCFWKERGKWKAWKNIGSTEYKIKPYQTKSVSVFLFVMNSSFLWNVLKKNDEHFRHLTLKIPPHIHLHHEWRRFKPEILIHLTSSSVI